MQPLTQNKRLMSKTKTIKPLGENTREKFHEAGHLWLRTVILAIEGQRLRGPWF
jgi:hypothetical protein